MENLNFKEMKLQELSQEEVEQVKGGFLGILLAGIIVGYQIMQMLFD